MKLYGVFYLVGNAEQNDDCLDKAFKERKNALKYLKQIKKEIDEDDEEVNFQRGRLTSTDEDGLQTIYWIEEIIPEEEMPKKSIKEARG